MSLYLHQQVVRQTENALPMRLASTINVEIPATVEHIQRVPSTIIGPHVHVNQVTKEIQTLLVALSAVGPTPNVSQARLASTRTVSTRVLRITLAELMPSATLLEITANADV